MDIFDVKTSEETHKRLGHKMKIITIRKKKKTKMKGEDIYSIAKMLMDKNPEKKLMIKCLSDKGYFQIKGYQDDLNVILDDDDYFNGRDKKEGAQIYKATFYLL